MGTMIGNSISIVDEKSGVSGASAFDASAYEGYLFDFDPGAAGSVFQDSAKTTPAVAHDDPLGCIVDQGPNAVELTSTLTARPLLQVTENTLNDFPTMEFDGVNDLIQKLNIGPLGIAVPDPLTVYVVSKTGSTNNEAIWRMRFTGTGTRLDFYQYSIPSRTWLNMTGEANEYTNGGTFNTWQCLTTSYSDSGNVLEGWVNGVSDGSTATATSSPGDFREFHMGNNQATFAACYIARVLIYGAARDADLEAALMAHYGLS